MRHNRTRGLRPFAAATVALATLLMAAPMAFADTLATDGDTMTVAPDASVDLGTVAAGAVLQRGVGFVLTCSGTSHLDLGATVGVSLFTSAAPMGGSISATAGTFGPLRAWPADGSACSSPSPDLAVSTISTVTIQAPPTDGLYAYRVTYRRTVSNGDTTAVTFTDSTVNYSLRVGSSTPPTLHLPSSLTVEGNERDGATASFEATASDLEDDTPPAVDCSPASGSHFPLGTTTVSCSATDTDGLTSTASFELTVVDTTAPAIGTRADVDAVTADPNGVVVTFAAPIADDLVDPSPLVSCAPGSGSAFPVGSTTVTCTASDASGNRSSTSFSVRVHLAQVVFDAPIGSSNAIDANGSRSIPVKASIRVDGSEVTSGAVSLNVARCTDGSSARTVDLTWSNGRWTGKLDTTGLGSGCWRATVVVGSGDASIPAGSFDVRVSSGEVTLATPHRIARADSRPS